MPQWRSLLHLGDLDLTIPAAAGLAAWLSVARGWRTGLRWSALFALGLALVGASKIAYMGWGTALPGLGFKAISGHATGVTALLPTVLYLLLQGRAPGAGSAGVIAGLGLGLAMAALLVRLNQHSGAEALAGWATGAVISLGAIRTAGAASGAGGVPGLLCCATSFLLTAWMMQSASIGYWMVRVALLLSGNHNPCPWDT